MLILDSDTLSKVPFIRTRINLDNTINLCIKPLYMNSISSMCIGNSDSTSFSTIGSKLTQMIRMSISEFYEFIDRCFDRILGVSTELIERVSLEILAVSMDFQEGMGDTKNSTLRFMHHPKVSKTEYCMNFLAQKYFCKILQ